MWLWRWWLRWFVIVSVVAVDASSALPRMLMAADVKMVFTASSSTVLKSTAVDWALLVVVVKVSVAAAAASEL